ncbi:hypothetical protein HDU90_006449 [Geranomyces variabilis]|nr:hypothetical protein HDU90_006449 [Geranomyces variabilis]
MDHQLTPEQHAEALTREHGPHRAIRHAVFAKRLETLRLLLTHEPTGHHRVVRDAARQGGHADAIALILDTAVAAVRVTTTPTRRSARPRRADLSASRHDALCEASWAGHLEIAAFILQHCHKNWDNYAELTIIQGAVERGDFPLVRLLLHHGVNGAAGIEALPATTARYELAELLLQHTKCSAPRYSNSVYNAYSKACYEYDIPLVKLFIAFGAPVTHSEGFSLIYSTLGLRPDTELLELLLDAGASGHDALRVAAAHGFLECAKILADYLGAQFDPDEALWVGVTSSDLPTVTWLLSRGADPTRALWRATAFATLPVAEMLLDAGADPNAVAGYQSALAGAVGYVRVEHVRLYLARGGDAGANGGALVAMAEKIVNVVANEPAETVLRARQVVDMLRASVGGSGE